MDSVDSLGVCGLRYQREVLVLMAWCLLLRGTRHPAFKGISWLTIVRILKVSWGRVLKEGELPVDDSRVHNSDGSIQIAPDLCSGPLKVEDCISLLAVYRDFEADWRSIIQIVNSFEDVSAGLFGRFDQHGSYSLLGVPTSSAS
jgi:hypothetical protein